MVGIIILAIMQIYSEIGRWYLPLIPVVAMCVLGEYSTPHTVCLMSFTVIYFVGIG